MASALLIDDHAMFREGLALALRQAAGPSLHLRTAVGGAEALALLKDTTADIALMDYYLPDIGGTALVRQLRRAGAGLRVMVLSASEDHEDAEAALAAGAHGFLHKSADVGQLLDAMQRVLAGQVVRPPENLPASLAVLSEQPPGRLTPRQTEVLCLLCEGLRNSEIAKRLATTEKTVKAHISAIFAALGVVNRTQAVLAARRAGLFGKPR
ncbi:response regulator transcription factor [Pigmentiphaga sp. GD03639]|uniref:response regulator transcription factor n=1 Tax=Pigmentiphaga sp. GD03639 TaxID=2975354 RepID=UPI00244D0386|nr:response regulator transcription factor [Pigmentiphaga sp. GD03639]MDH2235684.1 response regulator transcription factor [Pigmentiphaga sp. GD03639]